MKAHVLIRDQPWYRRSAFCSGLKAAGHEVVLQSPNSPNKDTVLLIWNRYSGNHEEACRVERAGGTVLVAENGYVSAGGGTPKFDVHPGGPKPYHYYALSTGFHNDSARINLGNIPRFPLLGLDLKPQRTEGQHILVCPNRSFGIPERAMPIDWAKNKADKLRRKTKMSVRIRNHPGNNAPKRTLAEDLEGAAAVYVWSSSCGVHSLIEGIPTFVDAPYWVMKGVDVESREQYFERLAYGQWSCEEISRGDPFSHLLSTTR